MMNLEDRLRSHLHATPDPDVGPGRGAGSIALAGRRRQRRRQVGSVVAGVVVAVGLVGGAATLLDDGSNGTADFAATEQSTADTDAAEESAASDTVENVVDDGSSVSDGEELDVPDAAIAEQAPVPSGDDMIESAPAFVNDFVVGVDEGFAGLRTDPSGTVLFITSADGETWSETPTVGLDPDAFLTDFAHDDGTFVALFETFDGARSVTRLGVSTNGVDWQLRALDARRAEDETASFSGLAIGSGGVLALATVQSVYVDPLEIAHSLGVVSESEFERFCGWDLTISGEPIGLFSCPPEGEEFDSEELEVFATIEPGDVEYDEIARALFVDESGSSRSVAVSGPVDGPLSESPLGVELFRVESVAVGSDEFAASAAALDTRVVLTSADGIDWVVARRVASPGSAAAVTSFDGELLVIVAGPEGTEIGGRSVRLAEQIPRVWRVQSAVGPAGIAILIAGDDGQEFGLSGDVSSTPATDDAATSGLVEEPIIVDETSAAGATQLQALLFSVDGQTWVELGFPPEISALGEASLVAVGDDEVLLQLFGSGGQEYVPLPLG